MPNTDINMKDHDLLIASYTLQQEMIRRLDDYIKSNDELHRQASTERHEVKTAQVKLEGQLTTVKGLWSNLDEKVDRECEQVNDRLSKVENNSKWFSVAAIIGSIIAGAISILVYVR